MVRIYPFMFAASRCPKCDRLHGLELPVKTTTCRLCGKRYDPNKGAIVKVFKDGISLRAFLQIEKDPDTEILYSSNVGREKDPSTIIAAARPGKTRTTKMILDLLAEREMTEEEIMIILGQEIDGPSISYCIEEMQRQGMLFIDRKMRYHLI